MKATVRDILRENDVLLAPMAGVTDSSFRLLCKEQGVGLTYTEMVSAKGLKFSGIDKRSASLLAIDDKEAPCAIQIFGSDKGIMAEQAAMLLEIYGGKIALIDINMGCPAHKIVGNGEGSALMKTPEIAAGIIKAVKEASTVPVTVKFRKGWDEFSVNAVEFALMAEDSGADAVGVHGRTRAQQYSGKADYDIIAQVKNAVLIPVIGNGDVFSPEDYLAIKERTACDGVFVARGAMGNPWIFSQIRDMKEGRPYAEPTPMERAQMALTHARGLVALKGDRALVEMRKHVAWYIKGLKGAAAVREQVNRCNSYEELSELLLNWAEFPEK